MNKVVFFSMSLMLLALTSNGFGGTYGGGSGTAEEPYLISDANHMQEIGANPGDWGKHFRMTADVNLAKYTGTKFNIIGLSSDPFTGVFDGNGFRVHNFTYDSNSRSYVGIFGYVQAGKVKNLGIVDPNVNASGYVSSVAGYLNSGATINNCFVNGGSISGSGCIGGLVGLSKYANISDCCSTASIFCSGQDAGGLVGTNAWATVSNCYSGASVSGNTFVGGLVGFNEGSTDKISNCCSMASVIGYEGTGGLTGFSQGTISYSYSEGTVEGIATRVGGLVGASSGTIKDSYSRASIFGDSKVGGLFGDNYSGLVQNCYSTGSVNGSSLVGGLAGSNTGSVFGCFWDIETSGQGTSAAGTPKTTAEMQTESTFTDAGWDFLGESANGTDEIWAMPLEGGYPIFASTIVHILTVYTEPDFIDTVIPPVGDHNETGWANLNAERFINCPQVYSFDHWIGDVEDVNSANTQIFMDSDKSVTAVYVDDRQCGDECHPYPAGDISKDCKVNFLDIAIIADSWLECTKPECD